MAIVNNPVIGPIRKSLGNMVFYNCFGKNRMRIKADSVKDANTSAQKAQRSKFVRVTKLACQLQPFIRRTFVNDASDMSQHHKFLKINYARGVVSGEYPDNKIDYSKMLVSKGKLLGVEEGVVKLDSGKKVLIEWKDNSGVKHSKANHKAVVLFMNETEKVNKFYFEIGTRSDTRLEIEIPFVSENDFVHVFFLFKAANKEVFSDSVYLGKVLF